jgi:hypothetical protein
MEVGAGRVEESWEKVRIQSWDSKTVIIQDRSEGQLWK